MNLDDIDTIFFDMDGTLIDLHFEDTFWLQHLPVQYAKHYNLPLDHAYNQLLIHNKEIEGTLNWYCLDYWDQYLGLNTITLFQDLVHLIQFRTNAKELLLALKNLPIRTAVITNAHYRSLALKDQHLNLSSYVDFMISSHLFGFPKEEASFWSSLHDHIPFDPKKTLFIDDNLQVLQAAKEYGISNLLGVPQPNSQKAPNKMAPFTEIENLGTLLPNITNIEYALT